MYMTRQGSTDNLRDLPFGESIGSYHWGHLAGPRGVVCLKQLEVVNKQAHLEGQPGFIKTVVLGGLQIYLR